MNDVSPPEPEHAHVLTSYAPPAEHRAPPRPRTLDRYVKDPALSPDGRLLACVVVEQDRFPFALQMPLDDDGVPIVGEEREVRLPVEGGVRRVLYSPDGHWLACEVAPEVVTASRSGSSPPTRTTRTRTPVSYTHLTLPTILRV